MASKITGLLVILSLIITVILLIFAGLIVAAGIIQVSFAQMGIFFYESLPDGIFNYLIASTLFSSSLGPPLSWGASLLNAVNSQWWLKTYMAWYIIVEIL
ncbi:MAG: hypothetical protein KIH08_08550 [Candidatus Freyarchaeota archaeon]|nr:hypothetical protein [Candidatus Jordarchaeia archaeon]MBS7270223.1 hypothetical protein [Candidatus Jordarchaeia archaeon]MBS7280521.1 hypothetical protein [Candidatus Jordarchaeia archaeon]